MIEANSLHRMSSIDIAGPTDWMTDQQADPLAAW